MIPALSSLATHFDAHISKARPGEQQSFSNFNRVFLLGYVGKDPTYVLNKAVVSAIQVPAASAVKGKWAISLATNRSIEKVDPVTQKFVWEEKPEWHNVSDFQPQDKWMYATGKVAKGSMILVVGKLSYRKDDAGKVWTNIVADKVQVLKPPKGAA
ncbi:hypothetical protein HDU98_001405 [Podochytrium sp. JEL0797]|nr:hypothetical protein HDU98_001405 [Podochytrium sp. JEL0797]